MNEIIELATNQGFAIAVAVYLLYERGRFNQKITATMEKIAITLSERLPDYKSGGVS